MRTNKRHRWPTPREGCRARQNARALQAARRAGPFYHRRVQGRTPAGHARYSAGAVPRALYFPGKQVGGAIRVEPWSAFDSIFEVLHPVWYT